VGPRVSGCTRRKRWPATPRLGELAEAGVKAVQVSFQDTQSGPAVAVAGRDALLEKLEFARRVRELELSLTVNVVLHAANIERTPDFVQLALDLGADRLELAHVQYHGWARRNRSQLLPSAEQVDAAARVAALAKLRHSAELDIVLVMPDHFSGRAKPCMGGWGQRALVVSPDGQVLPCHAAGSLPFEHERVPGRRLADIWHDGVAFRAFRGEEWMEEPCKSCPARARDFGGCRCQAFALTGRATAADPACSLSPDHHELIELRRRASESSERAPFVLRSHAPSPSQLPDTRGDGPHVG
jgi:PqqA peptide cyclase